MIYLPTHISWVKPLSDITRIESSPIELCPIHMVRPHPQPTTMATLPQSFLFWAFHYCACGHYGKATVRAGWPCCFVPLGCSPRELPRCKRKGHLTTPAGTLEVRGHWPFALLSSSRNSDMWNFSWNPASLSFWSSNRPPMNQQRGPCPAAELVHGDSRGVLALKN